MPNYRPNSPNSPNNPSTRPRQSGGQRPGGSGSGNKRRNMRYDRLLALIVVLVLLIVVLVKCCSGCSSSGSGNPQTTTTVATDATEAPTDAPQEAYANAVYISPSNDAENTFATGNITETTFCRSIAEKVKARLESAGVTAVVAGENDTTPQKVAMGNNGFGAYVGIQTNQGVGSGTSCFYNSASAQSQALAQSIYDPVAALTERDDNGLIDGSQVGSDHYEYEVASVTGPCCLIEVEYHDTQTVAQWLIDHEDEIADAIAGGICSYLGVTYTGGAGSLSTDAGDANTGATNAAIQDQLSE